MTISYRSTLVIQGCLAMRESQLAACRDGRHGLQIMSFEQAAVRLAGGFARPIDDESLRAAIEAVLPATPMDELESNMADDRCIKAACPDVASVSAMHSTSAEIGTQASVPIELQAGCIARLAW